MGKYDDRTFGHATAVFNMIGEENLDAVFSGKLKIVLVDPAGQQLARPSKPKLLIPSRRFTAEVLGSIRFDPAEFFKSSEKMFVSSDFQRFILPVAKPTDAGATAGRIKKYQLAQDMSGDDLFKVREQALWENTGEFCWWLAAKLEKQWGGKAGELDNTGNFILSLVKGVSGGVFVVSVNWDSVPGSWLVYAWDLSGTWHAGRSFTSRN